VSERARPFEAQGKRAVPLSSVGQAVDVGFVCGENGAGAQLEDRGNLFELGGDCGLGLF